MSQPTLQTSRLTLVPLAEHHLEFEVRLDSDAEVMRYLTGRPSTRQEVVARHATRLAAGRSVDGLGFWVGLVGGEPVGWWLLQPVDGTDKPGVAELGYRMVRSQWKEGLATEGARELVRHGFDDVGLDRIMAETMSANSGSRAVMVAVGLRHVRTFRPPTPVPGVEGDEVEYALGRDEWLGP